MRMLAYIKNALVDQQCMCGHSLRDEGTVTDNGKLEHTWRQERTDAATNGR